LSKWKYGLATSKNGKTIKKGGEKIKLIMVNRFEKYGGGSRPIISPFGFRSGHNYEKIGVFKKKTFFSESDS